ncbi:hypothetical protein Hanom_Chr04g00298841 [Helianthus anomalus]
MTPQLSSLLFLVVGISMTLTPWLAAGGQFITSNLTSMMSVVYCLMRVRQIIYKIISLYVGSDVLARFSTIKTFVRAHDVDHVFNLEKSGATTVFILLPTYFH